MKNSPSNADCFRQLIEQDTDGVMVLHSDGTVLFANPASLKILNLCQEELFSKPFPYPIEAGGITEVEIKSQNSEKPGVIEIKASAIEWENKPALLITLHDITEMQEIERLKAEVSERKKMNEVKEKFVSTVSHEIRTPLTIIQAILSNLKDGIKGPLNSDQLQSVLTIIKNVERLNLIITDILDLSRLESGHARLHLRTTNMQELSREINEGLKQEAEQNGLSFIVKIPNDLPSFKSDPNLILQVFDNLLSNAVHFAKSKIVVEARETTHQEEACIEIIIIDDGPGIPLDKMHLLFNKFEQINRPSGGAGYKGTGLGLAISKQIIELLRGQIWAECKENQTEFHFTLPLKINSNK